MEAFAALGVAVNITQAIDYGFRLIRKSKDLRELGVTDPALNDDARRLNILATSLTSQDLTKCSGELRNLAVGCVEVSKTLISELEKLKPTDPKSTKQRVKAIWKRERKGSRIMELERRLKDYKSQLSLHLTSLSRIEFNDKLEEVNRDVQKMRSELAAMHVVAKELSNSDHIGQEISRTLQPLVQQYYDRYCRSSELAILDRLHFPDMHERFDTIPDAHAETLGWLLGPNDDDRSARGKAGNDLLAWLRQGSGFFHISGKPGAGKSTLMKYICSHRNLDEHLKVWCQGAQLGRGQFFFWKPGTSAQKSIKGLLRGLLHSILDKHRDLIPTAFPELWKHTLARSSSSRQLEYRDFQQGFHNLLQYAGDSGLYKFVLFIDGLDEFEGRHLDLITTMKEWTENYPLKICVSSREYGVFLQSFSLYPKLRLHECNSVDIKRMASARLKSNPLCADLFKSDNALREIVDLIGTRADGVFIWVSVVLAGVEDAIISGADLSDLGNRICAYPEELDDLYWHLVRLVHETDRKWAFRALQMAQFFQSAQPFQAPIHRFRFRYILRFWNLSLLQLSFLDDIQYDGATVDFPKASVLHRKTAAQRLENTYKKVYGRCKGFLHVTKDKRTMIPLTMIPRTMDQRVVFTHRSIVEFLETPGFVKMARPYISDFDCLDNAYGTIIQCIGYQQAVSDVFAGPAMFTGTDFTPNFINDFWKATIDGYLYLTLTPRCMTPKKSLHYLEGFRERLLELSKMVADQPSISAWTIQYFALIGLKFVVAEPWKHIQASFPHFEHESFPKEFISDQFSYFLHYGIQGQWSNMTEDGWIAAMGGFLSLGFNFNLNTIPIDDNVDFVPLRAIIMVLMMEIYRQTWRLGIVIDWCLRNGADPDLTIGELVPDSPPSLPWLNPSNRWQLIYHPSQRSFLFEDLMEDGMFHLRPGLLLLVMEGTSPLFQVVKENGGVLKLRHMLSYWFPDDKYFPKLIDSLQSGKVGEHSDSTLSPAIGRGPPRQIVRRAREKEFKVYTPRSFREALDSKGLRLADLGK
ncbi:hypothetical protein F5B21DRAFT_526824 [Xylaria acuta]|nr:hypothetical protein F5B21DRAFT_526824 [Xylaria acuta]